MDHPMSARELNLRFSALQIRLEKPARLRKRNIRIIDESLLL